MPRTMPDLETQFSESVDKALAVANAGELARLHSPTGGAVHREFHYSRLENLYELAYLKIFLSWEVFLEQSFLRYLCGQQSNHGQAVMADNSPYFRCLADAEAAVLSGRDYKLWHNPQVVIKRVRGFVVNGQHEFALRASQSRVEWYAAVRHRIAHSQNHARQQFDNATMQIAGRRYPGARAGRFLRSIDASHPTSLRWIEVISQFFKGLVSLIV